MKLNSRPVGTIIISEPVLHIYRRAAEKDGMDVMEFISQQLALWAGILCEAGWAVPEPPEEEVDKPDAVPDKG